MIGTRVALVPPRPYVAIAGLTFAVLLNVLAVVLKASFLAPLSILPAGIGLSLLLSGERRFRARFTPTALEIARPQQTIPYATILEVRPVVPLGAARPRSFAIEVVHRAGGLLIPPSLSVSSTRVYTFLRGLLQEKTARDLPPALLAYQREQEQTFGAERVWSYGGRRGPFRHPPAWWRAVGTACPFIGLAWIAVPFVRPSGPVWYFAGTVVILVGVALLVAEGAQRAKRTAAPARSARPAGLVISPVGLAMEQDALTGHLTWQEIRKVGRNRRRPSR